MCFRAVFVSTAKTITVAAPSAERCHGAGEVRCASATEHHQSTVNNECQVALVIVLPSAVLTVLEHSRRTISSL